jgi:hypothetical protein
MSWRDRLARYDSANHADVASAAMEAIGTIGAIGSKKFSATARHRSVAEGHKSDHDSSREVLPESLAVSVESAVRVETPRAIENKANAISANSAGVRDVSWHDDHEERAAIIEHDGKIPREWAEGFARLDADRPPGDVPLKRWRRFVDDVGLFLNRWAAHAAALGWGPYDLFGCDRDRPIARIDQAGLLWLLNGDHLIALTENTATIETQTGARQTYYRKPRDPGRLLAWELAP